MVDEVRVGIVGSGIGGAAAAWYLQNMTVGTALEGRVRSVVFESLNRVGGRLYAMEMGGNRLNVGGDAWAQVNWYVRELAAAVELPLETSFYGGNDLFGLYEGDGRWVANATRLLESASSDWGMIQALAQTEMALSKNYKSRGMQPFDSIGAFLQYGSLDEFTTQETQRFLSDKGVAQTFVDTLIGPLCQVIYDQTPSMQAFAGMVSVLSVTSTPYSALDGNDNLPRTLLQQAPSTSLLLSTTVLSLGLSSNASSSPSMNNSSPIYLVTI
ncbi:MAG: NAD(P)-binding protein, partial [archaeon]|nr:NAD(P)-binding protein [archaeon]